MTVVARPKQDAKWWPGKDKPIAQTTRRVEVKLYQVRLICPECETGHMVETDEHLGANNVIIHQCSNETCGARYALRDATFPYTIEEPVEG